MKNKNMDRVMAACDYADKLRNEISMTAAMMNRMAEVGRSGFIEGARWAMSNRWREVNDVMPPVGEVVLAYWGSGFDPTLFLAVYDGEDWVDTNHTGVIHPSHWMEIPKFQTTTNNENK